MSMHAHVNVNVYDNVRDQMRFANEKMQKISLFDTPRCMVDLYCARPGQGQSPHVHEGEDKAFFVIDGEGDFQIGGQQIRLGPGAAAIALAGIAHGLNNPGPGDLLVLVTITPPISH